MEYLFEKIKCEIEAKYKIEVKCGLAKNDEQTIQFAK